MALLNNFTYSKFGPMREGVKWRCPRHSSKKCKAYLVLNESGQVLKKNDDHTHEPFQYYLSKQGIYMRVG